GILLAVLLSVLNVFRKLWWPYQTELGHVPGVDGYHDVTSYPNAERLPGLVVYRFDAPLLFANARTFRDQVRALAAREPRRSRISDARSNSRSPTTGLGSIASHGARAARRTLPPCRSWCRTTCSPCDGASSAAAARAWSTRRRSNGCPSCVHSASIVIAHP